MARQTLKLLDIIKMILFSSVEMCSGKDVYCEQIIYHFPEKKFFLEKK